jgi:hypothetical protein
MRRREVTVEAERPCPVDRSVRLVQVGTTGPVDKSFDENACR